MRLSYSGNMGSSNLSDVGPIPTGRAMVLVAKLVDAPDCGSGVRNHMWVRFPSFTLVIRFIDI